MALCVICRSTQSPEGDNKTVKVRDKGYSSLKLSCDVRGEKSLKDELINLYVSGQDIIVHKECRRKFTFLRGISDEKETPPPAKKSKHTAVDDEKKAYVLHNNKPGRPACPVSTEAFKKTCQWLKDSDQPKTLQEVEAHMAVHAGEDSTWSRRYLQNKLEEHFGDIIEIKSDGYNNIIHFKNTVKQIIGENVQRDEEEVDSMPSFIQNIRDDILKHKNEFCGKLE